MGGPPTSRFLYAPSVYLFIGDESNATADEGEFFIYGGLMLSDDQAIRIHQRMVELRRQHQLGVDDRVKFTTHARPAHVSIDDWRDLKAAVLDALVEVEAVFMAYYVHHRIADPQGIPTRNRWAVEAILYRFQLFLREVDDFGFATFDNIEEADLRRYDLARINTEGLTFDGATVALDRIVGLARSHVEWTHLLSATDVALGAFAYTTNHPERDATVNMMRRVSRLFWGHQAAEGIRYIGERGLIRRPQAIRAPDIAARYTWLEQHVERLLNV